MTLSDAAASGDVTVAGCFSCGRPISTWSPRACLIGIPLHIALSPNVDDLWCIARHSRINPKGCVFRNWRVAYLAEDDGVFQRCEQPERVEPVTTYPWEFPNVLVPVLAIGQAADPTRIDHVVADVDLGDRPQAVRVVVVVPDCRMPSDRPQRRTPRSFTGRASQGPT